MGGCCECGYEPLGFLKCGEFLDWLWNCSVLKKESAQWSWLILELRRAKQLPNNQRENLLVGL